MHALFRPISTANTAHHHKCTDLRYASRVMGAGATHALTSMGHPARCPGADTYTHKYMANQSQTVKEALQCCQGPKRSYQPAYHL